MLDKIIVAGFGGQGALRIGQMIAYAGMKEGKEVSWLPSYGSEMRGGTANCSVIVSDKLIASPVLKSTNFLIAMNQPSLLKYESMLEPGGTIVVNSSMVFQKVKRSDVSVYYVPANEIAKEVGNERGMNMVMLGAYIALTGHIKLESVYKNIEESFTGSKAVFAVSNKELVKSGYELMKVDDKIYKILVINNGSTSIKLAYYENEKKINEKTIDYTVTDVTHFKTVYDQKDMRRKSIETYLDEIGVKKEDLNILVSRGMGGASQKAGGYLINSAMVKHCWEYETPHASSLGPIITYELMHELKIPGYIYDSEGVDEFNEYAKLSGLKEFPVKPGSHTLNQKATARKAAEKLGGKYQDYNFVVAHLGGGLSIACHEHGVLTDSTCDAYSPQRAGGMPKLAIVNFLIECFSGKYTLDQLLKMNMGRGGLVSYLGTSDLREVERRIAAGDKESDYYFRGMVYQISKDIAAMSTVVCGKVDSIVLTGGMAHSKMLTEQIKERVGFIAPVEIFPGSHEMEALVLGALRIVRGEEKVNEFGE